MKTRKYRGKLTERQFYILTWIVSYIGKYGYPPTQREIGKAFGIRSTNGVTDHLRYLENKGFIRRPVWGRSRGIQVLRLPDGRKTRITTTPVLDMKPTEFSV